MSRLNTIAPERAKGMTKTLYKNFEKQMGKVPNVFQAMANSPIALAAYNELDRLSRDGTLKPQERDVVRLVTSQFNQSDYCLAMHTKIAHDGGLKDRDVLAIRRGSPGEEKHRALADLTRRILETKGHVDDDDLRDFRKVGYGDEQIAEVVTIISQETLSNYFNRLNQPELDFPPAQKL
jgi:uncharacterized peroxidase-related enzyme